MKRLRGMTWGHTRGTAPIWATALAYQDFHKDVSFQWDVRSFKDFGEGSIDGVLNDYDFLLIDHPFVGYAAEQELTLAVDDYVDEACIRSLAEGSIGRSWESYCWAGRQVAIPVDAACQVSAWRADILDQYGLDPPCTVADAISFAENGGRIAMPMRSMGLLCAFFSICDNLGKPAFEGGDEVLDRQTTEAVVCWLRRLGELCHPLSASSYPPDLLGIMATTDEIWYMPITFGYSVYSLEGYSRYPVSFGPIPAAIAGGARGGTIGGVGIAVSRKCRDPRTAFDFASWVGSAPCQATLYSYACGQPAHAVAWRSAQLDTMYNGFFTRTRGTLEAGFLRPRYPGYHEFQSLMGEKLHQLVFEGGSVDRFLDEVNQSYRVSQGKTKIR